MMTPLPLGITLALSLTCGSMPLLAQGTYMPGPMPATSGTKQDPTDMYLEALRLVTQAAGLVEKRDYIGAIRLTQQAEDKFGRLAKSYPQWRPNLLQTRRQLNRENLDQWQKLVALFAELTNSAETGFNRKGFDAYFKHVQAQDYFFDANNILIKRQRNNIFKLFQASKQACRQVGENLRRRLERSGRGSDEIDFEIEKLNGIYDQRNRRMISGNLVGEIFKLNDFKKPSTRLGERYAE